MSNLAIIRHVWAPIIIAGRSEWPAWAYIRSTRREAKKAYLEDFERDRRKQVLKQVRFARVTIVEEPRGSILQRN